MKPPSTKTLTTQQVENRIKVCIDPQCEEVAHNVSKNETRCRNCGMLMVEISKATYLKKFARNYFQYDYLTNEYHRPMDGYIKCLF